MSTHGYSQNQILVWKYPSLTQVAKLTGHSYRVLYLVRLQLSVCGYTHTATCSPSHQFVFVFPSQAVSPDGEAIVTGAGDETLRFWNVFSKTRCTKVQYIYQLQCCISITYSSDAFVILTPERTHLLQQFLQWTQMMASWGNHVCVCAPPCMPVHMPHPALLCLCAYPCAPVCVIN